MQTRSTLSNGYVAPTPMLPEGSYRYGAGARGQGEEDFEQEGPAPGNGQDRAVLILPFGPQAVRVTQEAVVQSEQWFGAPAPIWVVTPAESPYRFRQEAIEAAARDLRFVCDQIASATTAVYADKGAAVAGSKPLKIWVVVDIGTAAMQATGESAVTELAEQVRSLLQMLDVVVWQRLRLAPEPEFLILATAAHKSAVALCRRRLAMMASTTWYLAGPARDEWSATAWQAQAATALAALLWTEPLPPSMPPTQRVDYAIGAAAWQPVADPIKRLLSLLRAQADIQQLLTVLLASLPADANAPQTLPAPIANLSVQQWLAEDKALNALVPAPPPVNLMRDLPRWWTSAQYPLKILAAHLHFQETQANQAQRRARQQWLATKLSTWEAAWRQWIETHLTLPNPAQLGATGEYCRQMQELHAQLRMAVQAVDEHLVQLAEATTLTENQVQRLQEELAQLCHDLPDCSLHGLWRLCTQPVRWPAWFWQRTVTLPRQLRRLSHLLTAQATTRCAEANAHTVRQLALAMWQDLRLQMDWVDDLRHHLTALAAYLEEQLTVGTQALPAPWDRERLVALHSQLSAMQAENSRDANATLARLLQQEAQDEWSDSTMEAIGEEVVAGYAAQVEPFDHWSVLDWLASTFAASPLPAVHKAHPPNGVKRHSPTISAVGQWLDQLAAQALPAWITPQQVPKVVQETWLIMARNQYYSGYYREQHRYNSGWRTPVASPVAQYRREVEDWLQTQPNAQWVDSAINALILLRRVAVE